MIRFRIAALALTLSALLTAGLLASVKNGEKAPDFVLEDQSGKTVKLSDYTGKTVVLEWTNPECPFVQRHYKADALTTIKLAEKYKDVVWLRIDSSSGHDTAFNKKTAETWKLTSPILNDSKGVTGKAYGAKTTPHLFIIDKDGTVAYQGAIDSNADGDTKNPVNYVSKALEELAAGKRVSTPQTKSYGCSVKY
jgi:peroxiredoxin